MREERERRMRGREEEWRKERERREEGRESWERIQCHANNQVDWFFLQGDWSAGE